MSKKRVVFAVRTEVRTRCIAVPISVDMSGQGEASTRYHVRHASRAVTASVRVRGNNTIDWPTCAIQLLECHVPYLI